MHDTTSPTLPIHTTTNTTEEAVIQAAKEGMAIQLQAFDNAFNTSTPETS
jgi:hypothetical protein